MGDPDKRDEGFFDAIRRWFTKFVSRTYPCSLFLRLLSFIFPVCIGMHLAYMELRLGIAHFFQAFPHARVSTSEGMSDDDMKQALHFLSNPQHHRCLIEAV